MERRCRADRVSVRHDRIPVVRCRLPETSSPDGPFLRGAPVFAARFGLAAAFVSPMPSDLSVGRFAAGRGSVRRFGSRQETLVDISYRSAGWGGGYLKIVLTRADSVRADRGRPSATAGRMSVRRSLPSASGNDASSEFSGGTAFATHSASCLIPVFDDGRGVSERVVFGRYPAAASDALCPTSVTMPEWAIRGRKSVRPRYPLAHGRLRFLFARVGPELAVAFRREILTLRPSGAGLLPFRDRTLARGLFQRAERLDIPARFFTFAR